MRTIEKVVERLRQMPRLAKVLRESRGLINTTDLLVATAATVILSSAVGGAAIATMNESKYGKAQPDGQTIATAIAAFYKDTGKWPGQAEQVPVSGSSSAKALYLVTTLGISAIPPVPPAVIGVDAVPAPLPIDYGGTTEGLLGSTALSTSTATCSNNSSEGFVGVTIDAGTVSGAGGATLKNINDYLVRKPSPTAYQNWKGPYLQADIKTDPWDRDWVLNLQPLYCSETITGGTGVSSKGNLGYAWLLSGGSNRTVSTALGATNLDPTGDDAGMNMGKLVQRGTGGADTK
ncbi:MAG: type II secretion system protein GspG [Vicinamibacterales bacterium]|nr:type II secretion system protein GspG [Vicinamibacterales bacterium]